MQSVIRIGSRESRLAMIQAEIIKKQIMEKHLGIEVELVTMKTRGDKILDQSLELIGGKGLFIQELEQALGEGRIDICVHSLKDMPMELPKEYPIVAYSKREDPRDVLVYKAGRDTLPGCGVVGTSSRRRTLQMKQMYPSCSFKGIRGNVETRLRKLQEEEYDGTVLAAAGLWRLGIQPQNFRIFETTEMIPAAGQGILAVQGRSSEAYSWLTELNSKKSQAEAECERAFVSVLGGGCTAPTAAYAMAAGNEIKLTGLYYKEDGTYYVEMITGELAKARQLGEKLADEMRRRY